MNTRSLTASEEDVAAELRAPVDRMPADEPPVVTAEYVTMFGDDFPGSIWVNRAARLLKQALNEICDETDPLATIEAARAALLPAPRPPFLPA